MIIGIGRYAKGKTNVKTVFQYFFTEEIILAYMNSLKVSLYFVLYVLMLDAELN